MPPAGLEVLAKARAARAHRAKLSGPQQVERQQPRLSAQTPAEVADTNAHRGDYAKQARENAIRAAVDRALAPDQPLGAALVGTPKVNKLGLGQLAKNIAGIPYGLVKTAENAGGDVRSALAYPPQKLIEEATGHKHVGGDYGPPTRLAHEAKAMGKQFAYDFSDKGLRKQGVSTALFDASGIFGLGGGFLARLSAAREAGAAGELSSGARLATGAREFVKPTRERAPIHRTVVHDTEEGPVHETQTVQKLLSPNPWWREFVQRPGVARMQARLDEGPVVRTPPRPEPTSLLDKVLNAAAAPKLAVQNAYDQHFGAETRFGRELRAERRVNQDATRAPLGQLSHAAGAALGQAPVLAKLPRRLRVGLSRGEEKLLQVVGVEGDKILDDPAALDKAITEHGLQHDQFIQQGESVFHHTRQQADLEQARQAAAENLTPERLTGYRQFMQDAKRGEGFTGSAREHRFLRALDLVSELGARREAEYIRRGLLKPENARWRLAAQYATFHGEPLTAKVTTIEPGKLVGTGPEQRRGFLQGEVDKLDKQIAAVERAHQKMTARTRPRTVAEAASRLNDIHQALDRAFLAFMGDSKLGKAERAEQLRRNRTNGLIELFEQHGVRKRGTHAALMEGRQPTVLHGLRQEAMQHFDQALREKRHPLTEQILTLRQEADQLEQGLRDVQARQYPNADEFGFDKGAKQPLTITHQEKSQLLGSTADARSLERARLVEQQLLALKGVRQRRASEIDRSLEQSLAKGTLPQQQVRYGEQELRRPAEDPEFAARLQDAIDAGHGVMGRRAQPIAAKINQLEGLLRGQHVEARAAKAVERYGGEANLRVAIAKLQAKLPEAAMNDAREALRFYEENKLPVPEGATYMHFKGELDSRAPTGGYAQPGRGAASIPPTSVGRYDGTVTHEFTAGTIRSGNYVVHVSRATAESYNRMVRLTSALDLYDLAWRQSTAVKRSKWDVAIRERSKLPHELRALLRHGDERLPIKQGDLDKLSGQELDALQQHLHPVNVDGSPTHGMGIGADLTKQGVRWVDSRILADLGDLTPRGGWVKVADAINNPIRFLAVYGRVAYILNLPGNLGMQVLHQGFMAPGNYTRAITLRHDLIQHLGREEGERVAALAEHFVGEGRSRAFSVGTGFASKPVQAVANFWSSFIDRYSRLSALVHEMRAHGVDISANPVHGGFTKEEAEAIRDFLSRPSADRTAAVRLANKQLVEFGNLAPFEKNVLRHLIFLYPWVSRATVWSLRYAIDHPAKAAILNEIGAMGAKELQKLDLPSYLNQKGYFPAFWRHGDPYLVNPTSINTFQTAADNGRVLAGLLSGGSAAKQGDYAAAPRDVAAPIIDLVVGVLQGQTTSGRASAGVGAAVADLGSSIPEVQMLQRAGVINQPKPGVPLQQQRVFQGTGLFEAFGPFAAGGMFPRRANLDVAQAKSEAERRAALGLVERTRYDLRQGVDEWKQEAVDVGLYRQGEAFDPALEQSIKTYSARQIAYAQEAARQGIPINHLTQQDRLRLDYDLLVRMGVYPKAEADQAYARESKLSDDEVKNVRRQLHSDLMGQQVITEFKREIKQAGGVLDGRPDRLAPGELVAGNVNLHDRPTVHNSDGTISTVRSITIEEGGRYVLIPTVIVGADGQGRVVSDAQAIRYYKRTGQQLGKFDSETDADRYAQKLHEQQAKEYAGAR